MEKMKIMVVDDEKRFLTTTKKLLEKKGVDVTIAECGADALEKLRDRQVHVVILDVKMPGMDGVATLRELKRLFPMVEVIMLTGHATMESAIEGLNAGAVDYLMKPTDPNEILDKAINAFQRRMAIDEKIRMAKTLGSLGPGPKEPDNA